MLFLYWLVRKNKEWAAATKLKVKDSLKEAWNSPSPRPYLKPNMGSFSKVNSICLVDFINKDNTEYAKSILQVLVP